MTTPYPNPAHFPTGPLVMSDLKAALEAGSVDKVKAAVTANAGAVSTAVDGLPPLSLASKHNHFEVVTYLLSAGAKATATDSDGYTALHHAAKGNASEALIKALVSSDSSVLNTQSKTGSTALHCASNKGATGALKTLLSLGADEGVKDAAGRSPMDLGSSKEVTGLFLSLRPETQDKKRPPRTPAPSASKKDGKSPAGLALDSLAEHVAKKLG